MDKKPLDETVATEIYGISLLTVMYANKIASDTVGGIFILIRQ